MVTRIRITTEIVFILSSLVVILLYWFADFYGAVTSGAAEGHGSEGLLVTRLNVTFFAVGFSLIGLLYEHHHRFLTDRRFALRYIVGYLLLLDGVFHLFAFNDHLSEPLEAAFFGVVAPLQIVGGLAFPHLGRRLEPAGIVLSAFLLGAYAITRSVPVWPRGVVEELDVLGLLSKALEVLTILTLVQLLRIERTERGAPDVSAPAVEP